MPNYCLRANPAHQFLAKYVAKKLRDDIKTSICFSTNVKTQMEDHLLAVVVQKSSWANKIYQNTMREYIVIRRKKSFRVNSAQRYLQENHFSRTMFALEKGKISHVTSAKKTSDCKVS